MPGLSNDDKALLSQDWRWVEIVDGAIKTRFPGAREADRKSPFMTEAGASAVLTPIHNILSANNRLIQVTVQGILTLNFRNRPPLVRLYYDRFGLAAGRDMICEGYEKRRADNVTTLMLYG